MCSLVQGSPQAFLPLIHHALMDYSFPLACWLAEEGFEMFGKNDLRFIESLYKVKMRLYVDDSYKHLLFAGSPRCIPIHSCVNTRAVSSYRIC